MTPIERAAALKKGHSPDRLPISMFYGAPAHALLGWTRQQANADGRAIAEVQKKVYETFGCDGVSATYGLHGMAVAFGAEMSGDPNIPPSILKHPLDINALSALDLDRVSPLKDPTAVKCHEAVGILQDTLGHEVSCGIGLTGAITSASGLVGTAPLLKAILRQPEKVHQLMAFATEANIRFAKHFISQGCGIMVADPVASGTMISSAMFREFVLPYSTQFVSACAEMGLKKVAVHICGDTTPILEDICECGYTTVSLDNIVDLTTAKNRIGHRVHLMGNVDPVSLYWETPEIVKAAVREGCKKAWDTPCGYTIATGCDMVYGTPMENAFAFMEEARKCAKYPMQPANFE